MSIQMRARRYFIDQYFISWLLVLGTGDGNTTLGDIRQFRRFSMGIDLENVREAIVLGHIRDQDAFLVWPQKAMGGPKKGKTFQSRGSQLLKLVITTCLSSGLAAYSPASRTTLTNFRSSKPFDTHPERIAAWTAFNTETHPLRLEAKIKRINTSVNIFNIRTMAALETIKPYFEARGVTPPLFRQHENVPVKLFAFSAKLGGVNEHVYLQVAVQDFEARFLRMKDSCRLGLFGINYFRALTLGLFKTNNTITSANGQHYICKTANRYVLLLTEDWQKIAPEKDSRCDESSQSVLQNRLRRFFGKRCILYSRFMTLGERRVTTVDSFRAHYTSLGFSIPKLLYPAPISIDPVPTPLTTEYLQRVEEVLVWDEKNITTLRDETIWVEKAWDAFISGDAAQAEEAEQFGADHGFPRIDTLTTRQPLEFFVYMKALEWAGVLEEWFGEPSNAENDS
ncbi:hypothetical protein BJ508DRAFT_313574 [Ascobolus immersus RN42]|uniref:Uncharacterized protein n=1 Tax=Ascobolus immersus RN42 TaxID=1160509 RepID=A0A3N4HID5_ASCIM|nr:hypothetical protein BJ508DRAFT_313574 [Ascobolus immersus RN42]